MNHFEEEWSQIVDGELIIKWYYFPTTASLNVKITKIKMIQIRKQSKCYEKNWGSVGLTWWSCDMKRNFRHDPENFYNVKIDIGECFKKGLTVRNIDEFLAALRKNGLSEKIHYE